MRLPPTLLATVCLVACTPARPASAPPAQSARCPAPAPPPSAAPFVETEPARAEAPPAGGEPKGYLSPEAIRGALRTRADRTQRCFDAGTTLYPPFASTRLSLRLTIDARGAVTGVEPLGEAAVARPHTIARSALVLVGNCIVNELLAVRFPAPLPSGAVVTTVTIPGDLPLARERVPDRGRQKQNFPSALAVVM